MMAADDDPLRAVDSTLRVILRYRLDGQGGLDVQGVLCKLGRSCETRIKWSARAYSHLCLLKVQEIVRRLQVRYCRDNLRTSVRRCSLDARLHQG